MELLQTIVSMIVTLGILVAFHEYGHFQVARWCGVKVLRFSIGFGTPLLRWYDKQGTEFVIAALPLGGYVKMVDEREGEVAETDRPYAFNRQSVQKRIAIVAAGPLANFILAVVAFWFVFISGVTGLAPIVGNIVPDSVAERAGIEVGHEIVAVDGVDTPTWQSVSLQLMHRLGETGTISFVSKHPDGDVRYESQTYLNEWLKGDEEPDLLRGIGFEPYRPALLPVVGELTPNGPAEMAGLQRGDIILQADGVAMDDWETWVNYVRERPGQSVDIVVDRQGVVLDMQIQPAYTRAEDGSEYGRVGMGLLPPTWPESMLRQMHYGPLGALVAAADRTWELSVFTLGSIEKMISGLISPKNLSGPITIAKVAGDSARSGVEAYLSFLALLSVSLGVLNLLPVPVLDGGHLLFYGIEWIKGSPVSERIQLLAYQFGIVVVISLMIFAFYNDIVRL
ncbi:MAG TPA: RIP metalloprotease RseP [Pseudomonadales bacterium]|nr:RIP metalloprotease RseP [Pseudomonadales bacterium]